MESFVVQDVVGWVSGVQGGWGGWVEHGWSGWGLGAEWVWLSVVSRAWLQWVGGSRGRCLGYRDWWVGRVWGVGWVGLVQGGVWWSGVG